MGIGLLFKQTWRAYQANAGASAKIMMIYYFIPLVVLISLIFFVAFSTGFLPAFNELSLSLVNLSNIDKPGAPADAVRIAQAQYEAQRLLISAVPVFIAGTLFGLAFFFVSFFAYAALIGGASRFSVMNYSSAVKAGKEIYWPLMGCIALFILVAIALELVLIIFVFLSTLIGSMFGFIGSILFFFGSFVIGILAYFALLGRWILAPYALAMERVKVIDSFKKSWAITYGRTWVIIVLLLFLIALLIICMSILMLILYAIDLSFALFSFNFESGMISERFLMFVVISQTIIQLVLALFITPFVIYFFKQMYISWDKPQNINKRMFK